jgi:hypothetical protein
MGDKEWTLLIWAQIALFLGFVIYEAVRRGLSVL